MIQVHKIANMRNINYYIQLICFVSTFQYFCHCNYSNKKEHSPDNNIAEHAICPEVSDATLFTQKQKDCQLLMDAFKNPAATKVLDLATKCVLEELPAEICNLTNLIEINLDGTHLKSLPSEIGNLTNLELLDIAYNPIAELPPTIAKLHNLKSLILDGIYFPIFPLEIGKLTALEKLSYRSYGEENKVLTFFPPEIFNLINLQYLDLYEHKFKSLPNEIGNLKNLKILILDSNQLGALPAEIGNLINLEKLGLFMNRLSALPPEIGNLEKLQYLDLEVNYLSTLPPEITNLLNLQQLELMGNAFLTALPDEIGNLSSLSYLNIAETGISYLPTSFCDLNNLETLLIGNLNISNLPEIRVCLPGTYIIQ